MRLNTGFSLGLAALSLTMLTGATAPAKESGGIHVSITDLRSHDGVVRACLTARPEAFPKCDKDPAALRKVVDAGERADFWFKGVAAGRYAIAVLHDENDNGKADRAITMIPTEGFGFSRDAKVRFGPPKFEEAAFELDRGNKQMPIRMRYIL
ncbi:DUF2141 domain-containing protein [Parapontixanthobacter aurantiacus]|nr:DUF2141 domain-containing protein [Parapontixanthobacter aurantiacus]